MPKLEIRATNTGKGVFAFENIPKGTRIIEMTGMYMHTSEVEEAIEKGEIRQDDPFQVDEDNFIKLDEVPYYFNHSCNPSAGVSKGIYLVALRDVQKREEITFDYSTVVCTHCDWSMDCKCGSEQCRKTIGPVDTLPKNLVEKYQKLEVLPQFIVEELP